MPQKLPSQKEDKEKKKGCTGPSEFWNPAEKFTGYAWGCSQRLEALASDPVALPSTPLAHCSPRLCPWSHSSFSWRIAFTCIWFILSACLHTACSIVGEEQGLIAFLYFILSLPLSFWVGNDSTDPTFWKTLWVSQICHRDPCHLLEQISPG